MKYKCSLWTGIVAEYSKFAGHLHSNRKNKKYTQNVQSQPMAIRTYFTRWRICASSLIQINTIFAKWYVFYELLIRMNLYKGPTSNPSRHWGLDKSYEWGRTNLYELATS